MQALTLSRHGPDPHPSTWHVNEAGDGPPLLLLHGLGASSFSYRHNVAPLSRHFRVLAPDLPPHGRSPAPPGADYSLPSLAAAVMDFLNFHGLSRVAVAGNSLGGALALLLARDYPERITALVLLAPAAAVTRLPWICYPLGLPILGPVTRALLGAWIIPLTLHLVYYQRELITPEVKAGYTAPFREPERRLALARLCQQLKIMPLRQVEDLFQQIRQPVALLWGDHDRILPVSQAYWIKKRLEQAELHLLSGVGHAPQEEDPETVNKIIIDFLTRSLNNKM